MKINLLILDLFSLLVWNDRLYPLWQKSDIAVLMASCQGLAWHLCYMPKSHSSFTTLSDYSPDYHLTPVLHWVVSTAITAVSPAVTFWLKRSLCYIIIKGHYCISSSNKIKMYILTEFLCALFFHPLHIFLYFIFHFFQTWSHVVLSSKFLSFFSGEKSIIIR